MTVKYVSTETTGGTVDAIRNSRHWAEAHAIQGGAEWIYYKTYLAVDSNGKNFRISPIVTSKVRPTMAFPARKRIIAISKSLHISLKMCMKTLRANRLA